jgi:CO/xanthine dehydrogenase Mo-binding subunit
MTTSSTAPTAKSGSQIGRSLPRIEGRDKVTGRAEYTHTMRLPGMLHAKIFRSTIAHGKIKSVDTSAARAVPGVVNVVTIEDVRKVIPNPYYGPAFHDQPILADGKVRFVGEPVAVVLSRDPHVADQATQLISADYEELPAVFDEIEALTSQTFVHDELKPAGTFTDLKHLQGIKNTNVALDYRLRRGNFEQAFVAAEHQFEHEFKTQKVLHLSFEPFATIADYRPTGVTIHTASQGPSFVRAELARQGPVPRQRLRLQALHQARSTGPGSLDDHARAGEGRRHHGGNVLPDHQASVHLSHQERS